MNVSHKHKVIWLAPEKTATKIISQILSDYDFIFEPDNKDFKNVYNDSQFYCSNESIIKKKYKNYKIILSIRNPYDRIVSLFLTHGISNKIAITKDNKIHLKPYLWDFFYNSTAFESNKKIFLETLIKKWKFLPTQPTFLIKTEELFDGLSKIDFITESENWKNGKYSKIIENKPLKSYEFSDLYDIQTAKLVYEYFKSHFYDLEYDPFSFTKEKLTKSQKLSFIHDVF
mgnify:CR=1 FL=1